MIALKCRRPLPPGRDMALVWGAKIAGAGGKPPGPTSASTIPCARRSPRASNAAAVNAQAGCNPVEKAHVRFTAPVAMNDARAIRIKTADGKQIAPVFDDDARMKATLDDVSFAAPLPQAATAKLILPAGIKDESGRSSRTPSASRSTSASTRRRRW